MCILLLVGAVYWLESNEEKIIQHSDLLNGQISFREANWSLFRNFPKATLILKEVTVADSSRHQSSPIFKAQQVEGRLNLKDWKKREFVIDELTLSDGHLHLIKDKEGNFNLAELLPKRKNATDSTTPHKNPKIDIDSLNILMSRFYVSYTDEAKTMNLSGMIKSLKLESLSENDPGDFQVDIESRIEELTFKEKNGSYLKDAIVKTKAIVTVDDTGLRMPMTDVFINEHIFNVEAQIAGADPKGNKIILRNKKTQLGKVKPLLPQKIRSALVPYTIRHQFNSKTTLEFKPGQAALVKVDFDLYNNDLIVHNQEINQVTAKGVFINRQLNEAGHIIPNQKGINVTLDQLSSQSPELQLLTDKVVINSNPNQKETRINSQVTLSGSTAAISQYYESDKFILEKGRFQMAADLSGPINKLEELILESSTIIQLTDANLIFKPAQVVIPLDSLLLIKKTNEAEFRIVSTEELHGHPYALEGNLTNLNSLLEEATKINTTSNLRLTANQFGWEDFIHLFSKTSDQDNSARKSEQDSKSSMKATLIGLNKKFKPTVSVHIDSFHYYDIIDVYGLVTEVHMEEPNILVLEQAACQLEQGTLKSTARFDLSQPQHTAFDVSLEAIDVDLEKIIIAFDYFDVGLLSSLDSLPDDFNLTVTLKGIIDDVKGIQPDSFQGAINFDSNNHENIKGEILLTRDANNTLLSTLNIKGNPNLFNTIFDNDVFIFQDAGEFTSTLEYSGIIPSLTELIAQSDIQLTIDEGAVLYKDVNVVFPLNDLELDILKDTADFKLYLYSDYLNREINLEGHIDNLSELVITNTGKSVTTKVSAKSPIINLSHAIDIFQYPQDSLIDQPDKLPIDKKMKKLVSGLFRRFQPEVHIELDTFIINDSITVTELNTGCRLIDSTYFVLDSTHFKFSEGEIDLNLRVDLSDELTEPFEANLKTSNLDLSESLSALKYLGSETLSTATTIDGQLSLTANMTGSFQDLKLITEKTQAEIAFRLDNLELKNVDVLNAVARKIYSPRIFDDLQFAPLSSTLNITGSRIEVDQMDITSNEIDFFVEGHIDYLNKTNIWLSIPLDNLKRNRKDTIIRRAYEDTKLKVHLEIATRKNGKVKPKLRLRKKKFYDQRKKQKYSDN